MKQPPAPVPRIDIVLPRSTDGASFAMYKAASASHVAIGLPAGATAQDFFVDGATWQLPHATVTRVRSSPQTITRGAAEIARDDAPTIQLYLQVAGEVTGTCEGRPERFGPGDIVIRDSRRGQQDSATAFDVRILMVALDRVPPILQSPGAHGLRLPGDQAGTRLLATAIEALVHEMDGLSLSEADHAMTALCQLAAGVAEAELVRQEAGRRQFADPQLDAAMRFIDGALADADLTAETVRRHIGTSRSALYRLFQPLGGVDAVIRQRRLGTAMRALLADDGPALSVTDLAASHGFRNATQFGRAFQARFGATPVQVRAKIVAGDKDWLREQAHRAGFASLEAWRDALAPGPDSGAE